MDTRSKLESRQKQKFAKDYSLSQRMPKWLRIICNTIFFFLTAIALATAVIACIFVRTPVIGPSMQPTINASWTESNNISDVVLINRLKKGERGDIIVVNHTDEAENKHVIKRLIATGGDYITIQPIINSENNPTGYYKILLIKKGETQPEVLENDFSNMHETYTRFNNLKSNDNFTFVNIGEYDYLFIEEGDVFYLGDNRNLSKDCSQYGPISASNVVGKVVLVINHKDSIFKECFKYFWNLLF